MKKIISLLCAAAVLLTLLTACGGSKDLSQSKYLGTWKAVTVGFKDEVEDFDDEFLVTLNPDGSASVVSEGETSNCTWSETGSGFKLKGDTKLTFKDDGDGVAYTLMGAKIHFEKQ